MKIQSLKKINKFQEGGKTRRQLNSWDSSIAEKIFYGLTDRLGKTKKPIGEPSLKESAAGQEITRAMDSPQMHLLPGVSAVTYSRDMINDIKNRKYGMAAMDLIGAFGTNYPFAQEFANAAKFTKWSKSPKSILPSDWDIDKTYIGPYRFPDEVTRELIEIRQGYPLTNALPNYPSSTVQYGLPIFGIGSFLKKRDK